MKLFSLSDFFIIFTFDKYYQLNCSLKIFAAIVKISINILFFEKDYNTWSKKFNYMRKNSVRIHVFIIDQHY